VEKENYRGSFSSERDIPGLPFESLLGKVNPSGGQFEDIQGGKTRRLHRIHPALGGRRGGSDQDDYFLVDVFGEILPFHPHRNGRGGSSPLRRREGNRASRISKKRGIHFCKVPYLPLEKGGISITFFRTSPPRGFEDPLSGE